MANYVKTDDEMVFDALVTLSKCLDRRAGKEVNHLDAEELAAFHEEHVERAKAVQGNKMQKEYVLEQGSERHYVKFVDLRLISIKNNKEVSAFMDAHAKESKIIVMRDWMQKIVKQFLVYPKTEVFQLFELQVDVTEHQFQPYFSVVADKNELIAAHDNIKLASYPKLLQYDPVARYFGLQPRDVVRVKRPGLNSGYAIIYREVVEQDISDLFGD